MTISTLTADKTVVKSFFTGVMTGLFGFTLAIAGPLSNTQALSVQTARDCDSNAVVHCGGETTTELHRKYNRSESVQDIYTHFGISDRDMAQLTNKAVVGKVTKGGRVVVDNETVARDAVTVGRQNMSGSTQASSGGTTFYKRPPSVSFQQSSLPAFVVMKSDGTFDYAIIASCGNPVTATPEKPEQPKPTPTPTPTPTQPTPTPTPTPAAAASSSASSSASSVASATVTVQQVPAPVQQPITVTPVQTQPVALPKTGLADGIYIALLAAIGGTAAHLLIARRIARKNAL